MEGREQTVGAAATAEGARPGDVHDVLSLWKNAGADDALRERAPPPPTIFREEDKTRINAMKDAGKKKTAALELAAAGFMDKQFKSKAAAAGAYRTEFAVEVTGRRIGQVVQQLEAAKRKLRAARGTTRPKMPPATSLVGGARKRRRGRANIPRGLPPRSRRLGQDATGVYQWQRPLTSDEATAESKARADKKAEKDAVVVANRTARAAKAASAKEHLLSLVTVATAALVSAGNDASKLTVPHLSALILSKGCDLNRGAKTVLVAQLTTLLSD